MVGFFARARDVLALCNIFCALVIFRRLRHCRYRRRAEPSTRCVWSYLLRTRLISAKYRNYFRIYLFCAPVSSRQPLSVTSLSGPPLPLTLPAPLGIAHVGGGGGWVRAGRLGVGEEGARGRLCRGRGARAAAGASIALPESYNSRVEMSRGYMARVCWA